MGKIKRISARAQGGMLKQFFPNSTLRIIGYDRGLVWEGKIQPSILSMVYDIKIEYTIGLDPDIYVISPNPLPLPKNETKLPHIYNHTKQQICLYQRSMNEWNDRRMIAKTIIPWASEWLLHYEIWVATGIWHGGGIH